MLAGNLMEGALEKTLQDKGVQENFRKLNLKIDFLNSHDTQTFLDSKAKKWSAVVKRTNIVIK
jgi:tripartite-type tricarboxylate transporter receptor subunit TctC